MNVMNNLKHLRIGNKLIGQFQNTFIIAEIGINHEGDISKCDTMIRAAAKVGVDAVKLQTMDADQNYVTGTESHDVFKGTELSKEETASMFALAKSLGLEVFTTLGDFNTADWINELDPCAWKISSGLLTHLPLIEYLANLQRPLLMSTGLSNLKEIDTAVQTARSAGSYQIGIFQCTSLYPAPIDKVNLSGIRLLQDRFSVPTGFSDHTLGAEAAFLSVGAGAKMIEKHFTFDRTRKGFDHGISLDPDEFAEMIRKIRMAEQMLGSPALGKNEELVEKREANLRCLVAFKSIVKGALFTKKNIAIKRPLPNKRGLDPKYFSHILGKKSKKSFKAEDPISSDQLN